MLKERILPGTLIPESGSLASQLKKESLYLLERGRRLLVFAVPEHVWIY